MAQEVVIIDTENLEEAYFAWGCFWCMESIFESQPWVEWAYVWYTGWDEATATYELTSAGDTDHREGVRVSYDPDIITYNKLVELFWTQIDPTDDGGQFNDRGFVYTTAIYYNNEEEKQIAEQSKANLGTSMRFDEPIVTQILPAQPFYDAEDYHQNYYKENSIRYKLYTSWSGRKEFIEENDLQFPYLIDQSQETARAYKAQCTPDVYLMDSNKKLIYHGSIDDNWQYPEKVNHHDLLEAVNNLANGFPGIPEENQKPSIGCSIKWRDTEDIQDDVDDDIKW